MTAMHGTLRRMLGRILGSHSGSSGRVYDQDGLRTIHNHDFVRDPAFQAAYARGVRAAEDYRWHWRVHVGLWVAYSASKLDGDFVECGVNRGFMSSAIMEYLDWDATNKTFYLLDTFAGPQGREKSAHRPDEDFYVRGSASVRANFAEWQNVRIIEGAVPDILLKVDAPRVAYLHLDMNCADPEVAAFEFFWDRVVPGGLVLMDDHSYRGYEDQKRALDAAAARRAVRILSLPTGQGLVIKPASRV
jgi:hypothetical protein